MFPCINGEVCFTSRFSAVIKYESHDITVKYKNTILGLSLCECVRLTFGIAFMDPSYTSFLCKCVSLRVHKM
jgi:hypothetical protein